MTIIYKFLQMVEKTHEECDKAKTIIKAQVKDTTITIKKKNGPVPSTRKVAQSSMSLDPDQEQK